MRRGKPLKRTGGLRRRGKSPRSKLRQTIWDTMSLAVRLRAKRNGGKCPIKPEREIEVVYHLVPVQKGDAIRYEPQAVIGASHAANGGEFYNRMKYLSLHERMFGKDFMDRLRARAQQTIQLRMDDLRLMLAFWEHRLTYALLDVMPANPHEAELRARGLLMPEPVREAA